MKSRIKIINKIVVVDELISEINRTNFIGPKIVEEHEFQGVEIRRRARIRIGCNSQENTNIIVIIDTFCNDTFCNLTKWGYINNRSKYYQNKKMQKIELTSKLQQE